MNNVLDTEKELTSTKEILLNEFTTEKLYYLKQYDDVCGNIEEKLQRTYSKMDEILEVIDSSAITNGVEYQSSHTRTQ